MSSEFDGFSKRGCSYGMVHTAGKGRSGTLACAYLLSLDSPSSPQKSAGGYSADRESRGRKDTQDASGGLSHSKEDREEFPEMKKARALQERAEVLMNEMPPDDDDDDEERAPRPKDEDIAGDVHTVDHPRKGAMGHRTGERCGGHAGPDDVMEGTVLGSLQANTPPPPLSAPVSSTAFNSKAHTSLAAVLDLH